MKSVLMSRNAEKMENYLKFSLFSSFTIPSEGVLVDCSVNSNSD